VFKGSYRVRGRLIPFLDPYSHFLCAVRSVCQAAGREGTRLAKRCLDDPACMGGGGAPPSQRPDYFRIDLEMELEPVDDLRPAVAVFSVSSAVGPVQSFAFPSPAWRGRVARQGRERASSFPAISRRKNSPFPDS
jgi:hypothetical protein